MRIPARTVTNSVGFNMTPLIDVVFLLIIFFLLSSHLARHETALALPLPEVQTGQRVTDANRPQLTVNVLGDGGLIVASRAVALEELTGLLAERRKVHGEGLEVRIRADRSVPYSRAEAVMLACARAGIWHVAYAVTRKTEN